MNSWPAALYLENGHLFVGTGFGSNKPTGGEAVFNTGMTGYQEIFTDPSYCEQLVTMTYPHIGNTGINHEDMESGHPHLKGVIIRDYCEKPSNWRSQKPLHEFFEAHEVACLADIDTRRLTHILRDEGAQRGIIFPVEKNQTDPAKQGKNLIEQVPAMEGLELVSKVSCEKPYVFESNSINSKPNGSTVVVYDFGVKTNILRHWQRRGFRVQVVPYNTPQREVLAMNPAAVMLSNGPGDPSCVQGAVEEVKELIGKIPIMAICMGHQLLARALGAETYKLKFGHHGINHPVKDLRTGQISITSQNHGFAVRAEDISKLDHVSLSHTSLNDETVEGYFSEKLKLLSVQFHPEAAPGPSDANTIFDQFIRGFLH